MLTPLLSLSLLLTPPAPAVVALGSPRYRDREAAQFALTVPLLADRLAGLPPDPAAVLGLHRGARSADVEVAVRSAGLLRVLAPCVHCRGAGSCWCVACDRYQYPPASQGGPPGRCRACHGRGF